MRILNPVFSHEGVQYRDGKRHAWLVSLLVPASLASGPFLYQATGSVWSLFIPVALVYAMIPLLDLVLGEDRNNPPEAVVPQLDADPYCRWVTYALVDRKSVV